MSIGPAGHSAAMAHGDGRVGVVMITRNRRRGTLSTLGRLGALPERPPVTVVDNASTDGTADAISDHYPDVTVVRQSENMGAAGRNHGVAATNSPYVAFSDDDSWWAPGALGVAAGLLDAHPRLGLIAATVLVGPDDRLDPVCTAMAESALPASAGPGRPVLGFVACGSVVRRSAFLDAGGFHPRYGVGGEEELLAIDLRVAGWDVRYCPEVVTHHHPATDRPPSADRRRRQARNALRTAWLRRRRASVARCTAAVLRQGWRDPAVRRGVADAVGDWRWIRQERRPIDPALDDELRLLTHGRGIEYDRATGSLVDRRSGPE